MFISFIPFTLLTLHNIVSASEKVQTTPQSPAYHEKHQQTFLSIQSKLKLLKDEAHKLSSMMKDAIGQNDAMDHMLESMTQAEDSFRHILEENMKVNTPTIGSQAKTHVVREIVSTILQFIGLYGVTITFGSLVYSLIGGLLVSGGFLTTSFAFLPTLFSSALVFPPLLILFEVFFGLSFVVGMFSWFGLTTLFDSYTLLLLNPQILEQIGIFTLVLGLVSSLLLK
jgi:hypothetical protein